MWRQGLPDDLSFVVVIEAIGRLLERPRLDQRFPL